MRCRPRSARPRSVCSRNLQTHLKLKRDRPTADRLHGAPSSSHVTSIYRKLGVNRGDAVRRASTSACSGTGPRVGRHSFRRVPRSELGRPCVANHSLRMIRLWRQPPWHRPWLPQLGRGRPRRCCDLGLKESWTRCGTGGRWLMCGGVRARCGHRGGSGQRRMVTRRGGRLAGAGGVRRVRGDAAAGRCRTGLGGGHLDQPGVVDGAERCRGDVHVVGVV